MEFLTRQSLANCAAEKWKNQYFCNKGWGSTRSGNSKDIYGKVIALGTAPNPDDVDAIIGNKSWTSVPRCGECNENEKESVVMIGEEPDYESSTAYLCRECLQKAIDGMDVTH